VTRFVDIADGKDVLKLLIRWREKHQKFGIGHLCAKAETHPFIHWEASFHLKILIIFVIEVGTKLELIIVFRAKFENFEVNLG